MPAKPGATIIIDRLIRPLGKGTGHSALLTVAEGGISLDQRRSDYYDLATKRLSAIGPGDQGEHMASPGGSSLAICSIRAG
jgi:hypothetical protein